jgi:hypothetical protein
MVAAPALLQQGHHIIVGHFRDELTTTVPAARGFAGSPYWRVLSVLRSGYVPIPTKSPRRSDLMAPGIPT